MITIVIHGQGRLTQATAFSWHGMGDGQEHRFFVGDHFESIALAADGDYDIELLEMTAIPSAGWTFDRMEIVTRWTIPEGKFDYQDTMRTQAVCALPNAGGHITDSWREDVYNVYSHELLYTNIQQTVSIDVYFNGPTPRGIIYSPTVNPGRIIYDLATGRPMVYA